MLRYYPSLEFESNDSNSKEDKTDESNNTGNIITTLKSESSESLQYRKKLVFLNYLWKHSLTDVTVAQETFGISLDEYNQAKSVIPALQRWCDLKNGSCTSWDLGYPSLDAYKESSEYLDLISAMKNVTDDENLVLEDYVDPFTASGKPEKESI